MTSFSKRIAREFFLFIQNKVTFFYSFILESTYSRMLKTFYLSQELKVCTQIHRKKNNRWFIYWIGKWKVKVYVNDSGRFSAFYLYWIEYVDSNGDSLSALLLIYCDVCIRSNGALTFASLRLRIARHFDWFNSQHLCWCCRVQHNCPEIATHSNDAKFIH